MAICKYCETEFDAVNKNQMFCTTRHRAAYRAKRLREENIADGLRIGLKLRSGEFGLGSCPFADGRIYTPGRQPDPMLGF